MEGWRLVSRGITFLSIHTDLGLSATIWAQFGNLVSFGKHWRPSLLSIFVALSPVLYMCFVCVVGGWWFGAKGKKNNRMLFNLFCVSLWNKYSKIFWLLLVSRRWMLARRQLPGPGKGTMIGKHSWLRSRRPDRNARTPYSAQMSARLEGFYQQGKKEGKVDDEVAYLHIMINLH